MAASEALFTPAPLGPRHRHQNINPRLVEKREPAKVFEDRLTPTDCASSGKMKTAASR
jgi:hypothetical protein